MSIRIAVGQFKEVHQDILTFARQLGVGGVQLNNPRLPGMSRWEQQDVRRLVERVEDAGLRLEAIENVPVHFYEKVMLGTNGRDAQIENYIATMRAVAGAGVPILGHHFMPNSVWRTNRGALGRGDAACTAFDMQVVEQTHSRDDLLKFLPTQLGAQSAMPLLDEDAAISESTMEENYLYFMRAVLPVAEEIGLKLALHPDDPPMPSLGGVARLFHNPENFKRVCEQIGDSPAWGLDLCLGSVSEMSGGADDVHDMIAYFGQRQKIFYIHFRDVQGTVPSFRECFLGEGNFDPCAVMQQLVDVGFDGFIIDDHVPHMIDDTGWGHRARAQAVGYLQGLLAMTQSRH